MRRILAWLVVILVTLTAPIHASAKNSGLKFSPLKAHSSSHFFKPKAPKPKLVLISKSRHPESAKHIIEAQNAGAPKVLTVDRAGRSERRRQALAGTKPEAGKDRDEYPPAMTKEGGASASVRHISSSDNRGAGACLGTQCRGVPDGKRIRVDVTD